MLDSDVEIQLLFFVKKPKCHPLEYPEVANLPFIIGYMYAHEPILYQFYGWQGFAQNYLPEGMKVSNKHSVANPIKKFLCFSIFDVKL